MGSIDDMAQPDTFIYDNASLIFQVNSVCNRDCTGCYFDRTGKRLDLGIFNALLATLKSGDLIDLRGGEPTLDRNWFENYVEPALRIGLNVAIETNGYFISAPDYQALLEKLNDKRITVRISFDEKHLEELNPQLRTEEFEKMARFAVDATQRQVQFGFYALGMDPSQIKFFLAGTSLEIFIKKFYSLEFYDDISVVPITGKYVSVDGTLHNRIV